MLKQSPKSIPDVGQSSIALSLQTDKDGIVLSASPSLADFTGKSSHELPGTSFTKFIVPQDAKKLRNLLTAIAPGEENTLPLIIKGKNGIQPVLFVVVYNNHETGGVLHWTTRISTRRAKVTDIQEQRGSWFEKFFRNSNELLCIIDSEGYCKRVNKALARLLGYNVISLREQHITRFVHTDDKEKTEDALSLIAEGKLIKELECRYWCHNGQIKWLSWSTTFLEEKSLVLAIARDITDRKTAEEELKKKTGELNMIVSSLDDIVFEYDAAFRYNKVWCANDSLPAIMPRQFLGKTPEEAFAHNWEIATLFMNDLRASFARKEIQYRDYSIRVNNEIKWYNSKISPLFNPDGSSKGFSQRITDISEKKKVELAIEQKNAELKKAHQEYNEIIEHASEIIFKLDKDGLFLFVSPEFERALGYNTAEILGKHFGTIIHPDDRELCQDSLQAIRERRDDQNNIIFRARSREGVYRWFSASATFLFDENGEPHYGIGLAQDISDLKRAMQNLEAAEERYKVFIQQSSEAIWRFELLRPIPADLPEQELISHILRLASLAECNEVFARQFGFEQAADMAGMRLKDTWLSDNLSLEDYLRSFISSGFNLVNTELQHTGRDGHKKHLLHNLVGITENGRLVRIWGLQRDITSQQAAEEAIHYQAKVLDNVFDAVISSGPDLKVRSWNHAAEKLYGLKAEEIIGHTIHDFISLQYLHTTRQKVLEELYGNGSWTGEAWFMRPKDGEKVIFLSSISILKDKNGVVTDIIAINKDITDKRMAEHAIRESEERFRQLADTAPVMIWVSDENDETVYVNKSWVNFTGTSTEDLAKVGWTSLVHPDDVPVAIEGYKESFKNREPVILEYRLKNCDNSYRWVVDHGVPRILEDGTFLGYVGSVMDIHDRKIAEEKIRFQVQVMQDVSDGLVSTDLDLNVISFNKAAENIYGYSAAEIIGHNIRSFIIHHYIGATREKVLQELYEKDKWEGQAYYDRHDGKRIYMHCSLAFVKDEAGRRIGFAGIHRDITEQRKSEEALRISEERYRSVVHALGEGIIMHDKNGEIIACNHSAEDILGVSAAMLVGKGSAGFFIYEDGTPFPEEQHPSWITLRTGQSLQHVIMGIQRADGALVWISVNTEPVYYTDQGALPDAVVASFVDITQKKAAEIELQHSQQQLREYSERITNILDSITDGFIAVDKSFNILMWNHAVERITKIKATDAIGSRIEKAFPAFIGTSEYTRYIRAIDSGSAVSFEHFIPAYDCWFETSVYPFAQGVFIYFRDITERKKQEELLKLEKDVLRLNAEALISLKTTIDFFLEGLERIFPGMLCSVLSLDDDQATLRHLSAPSLPVEYSGSLNGTRIGPGVGSCGTAMYRKEKVITPDINTDPLWNDFRALAQQYGLRACWSFPIVNARQDVLATIAIYYREPKIPDEKQLNTMERVSNLLRIIIENKIAETRIRVSNERYLLVTKATNDAIWDWDVTTNSLYWGEGFYNLFGYKPGYVDNTIGFWENCLHEEDRDRVLSGLNRFIENNNSQLWEDEYRFKKANGEYALVYDRGFLIFDHAGKINRMVGSMQDVTDKKELERKLLKQELDKQKLVAQAVVNAQEKERADIGKELHDNVNQILSTAKLYLELAKTEEEERLDLINRSTDNISDAINEIRNISRSLVPASVGDLGLVESIQDLVENIKATRKLRVEFRYEGLIDDILDEKRKLMLFRIIQEQVNNVLRHAAAANLIIELAVEDDAIDLTIRDDGKGFEPEKVKMKKGVGLSNIVSRAELFNGKVDMITAPGKGCCLNIKVPI